MVLQAGPTCSLGTYAGPALPRVPGGCLGLRKRRVAGVPGPTERALGHGHSGGPQDPGVLGQAASLLPPHAHSAGTGGRGPGRVSRYVCLAARVHACACVRPHLR